MTAGERDDTKTVFLPLPIILKEMGGEWTVHCLINFSCIRYMRGCEAAVRYAPASVFANEQTASQSPAACAERKRYNFGMLIDIPLRGIWGYDVPFKIEKIHFHNTVFVCLRHWAETHLSSFSTFFLTFMKQLSDTENVSHSRTYLHIAVSALEKVLGALIIILEQETRTRWFVFFRNQSQSAWAGLNRGCPATKDHRWESNLWPIIYEGHSLCT